MSNNIRLRTTPGGVNQNINISINQDFDFIEVLSLKISQDETYRRFSSDYGVVIGRVIVNNGVGVPNAKVSIFIPIDEEDKLDPEIFGLYPFEVVTDKDDEGLPYSLLPSNNVGKDECYSTVGRFESKRQIQDNPESEMIYCKYYKFTTTTNDSGDYMIFGIPVGSYNLHVEADLSDIGFLSQKPYNLISEGSNENLFKSPSQFKNTEETVTPVQLKKVSPVSVNVIPFWGDEEQFEIGITRLDVDLLTNINPVAIFMGSVITDSEKNSVNKNCRPRKNLGKMDELTTGPGKIEMIRKTPTGSIERYDVEGGRVIDENGVWCYQIPMNLEYKVTSESGELVPSNNPKIGIPTKSKVRFRIGMDVSGTEGKLRRRAKFLIPNNPESHQEADYTFDSTTKDESFTELSWNKLYSVKNLITRVQPNKQIDNRNFIGIKVTDYPVSNSPFPFNRIDVNVDVLAFFLLAILSTITTIVWILNRSVIYLLNLILTPLVKAVWGIQKLGCLIQWPTNKKKRAACRCYKLYQKDENQTDIDCAKAYYEDLDADLSDIDKSDLCNNPNLDCSDCDKKACKKYQADSLIPYFKLSCGNVKYFIWSLANGDPGSEDDPNKIYCYQLNNEAGQKIDCTKACGENGSIIVGEYLRCSAVSLADSLNMFKLDFYNDWVNGSLYLFLLQYKYKSNGEKFCDIECGNIDLGDYNDDSEIDNKCKNNFIIDSCPQSPEQFNFSNIDSLSSFGDGGAEKIKEGYIKRTPDSELYYASHSKHSKYKLFATDIINLGSINKYDWEGKPQMSRFLVDTTFNIPPLLDEKVDFTIETSGISDSETLLFKFGYLFPIGIYLKGDYRNCNNVKRLCELGMGLDENREDEGKGPINGKINNQDVENPFVRGLFSYLNSTGSTSVPLVYIDSGSLAADGSSSSDYNDENYRSFRVFPDDSDSIWQYENSYYFYFGLRSNNTALTKLNKEFLTPCIKEVDDNFQCQLEYSIADDDGNNPTGALEVEIIGGVEPLTYEWNGPTFGGQQYPLSNNINNNGRITTITELYSGTYNLKTTDNVGNVIECSFQVSGPTGVQCNVTIEPITKNGEDDGKIIIDVEGGVPGYTYELYDNDTNNLINNTTTVAMGTTFSNIGVGDYKVVVKDNGIIQTQCEELVSFSEPDLPSITVSGESPTCFNQTGSATLYPQDGSGTGDSTIEWKDSNGSIILTGDTQIFNLYAGDYEVTYTDSLNQSVTEGFTITEPPAITITPSVISGSTGYEVSFTINGGTPPYYVDLYDYDYITNPSDAPIDELNDISAGSHTFIELISLSKQGVNAAVIDITDDNGCNKEQYINLP